MADWRSCVSDSGQAAAGIAGTARWFAAAAVAAVLAMPSLAAAEPALAATALELTIVGGPNVNPNAQGRASPVVVRIFDLKSSRAFESAGYAALFERPGETLGEDVAAQEEFVLRPGDIQRRDRAVAPQVRALGVAAAFRDIDGAVWRLVVPLKLGIRNFLLIDLDADRIRLSTVDPGRS